MKHIADVDILIDGEKVTIVNAAKNLGLVFNYNLTWNNHINALVGQTLQSSDVFGPHSIILH